MMEVFVFREDWVEWVLKLASSSFFSILVDGTPSRAFNPSRGLTQGDPLSPFLYIILVEGIGQSITNDKIDGSIQGISLSSLEETLSHLKFVDDTFLIGKLIERESPGL